VEGGTAAASPRIRELVQELADQMTATFKRRMPSGGTLHIEEIQDQVELALMRSGEQKVARSYVLYREQRAQERSHQQDLDPDTEQVVKSINVVNADGTTSPLDIARIQTIVGEACENLSDVDAGRIINEAMANMYDGISASDVAT
jgi:ribonucleoside-diphosphate reductase alpha chain